MRRRRTLVAVVAVVALAVAACGGGGTKSTASATGSASNGASVSAGSGSVDAGAGQTASSASDTGAAGDSPVVGPDQSGGTGQPAPSGSGDAPAPTGLKPLAGHYRFKVSGQNDPAVTTIEDLNEADQRVTTPGSGAMGEQIQVMRFLDDRIDLLSLEMKGAFPKTFNGPVLLTPTPGVVGVSWAWDLTSTDNLTHVHQSSRVDRTDTVTIGGQAVDTFVVETDITITGDVNATGHLTSWVSPVYKLAVRTHSTLNVTTPVSLNSDSTAELVDLRPS